MSDRQVTVSFKYEVASGGGGRDPIAYLERLKRLQEEVAAGASGVGRYGVNSPGRQSSVTGPSAAASSAQPAQPNYTGLQSGISRLRHEMFLLRGSIDILGRIIAWSSRGVGGAGGSGSPDNEISPLIRLGRGRGFGDMGSGLGGGFGRMRIARAVLSPTSAAGMAGMMGLGPIGLAAGVGVAGAVAGAKGLSWAGSLADTTNRNDISEGTRERMFGEANPIVGGLRKWWREDVLEPLSGITNAIRQSNALAEKREAQRGFWFGQMPQVSALRMQEAGAANMAGVMSGAVAQNYQQFNRGNFLGERAYQEQNILLPLQERAAQSGRVAEARRMDVQSALDEDRRIGDQQNTYRARYQHRRRHLQGIEQNPLANRGDEVAARNLVIQAERDLEAISRNRMVSEQRIRDARVSAAQAASQERRDRAGILEGELQIVRARRDQVAQTATQFGAAGMVSRQMQEAAVEQFFRHGPGGVTQETIEMARQSPAAAAVNARLMAFGESTSEFQNIRRMAGMGTESRAGLEARENEIQNQLARTLVDDQQRLANELSTAFRGAADRMLDAIRDIYTYIGDRITDMNRRRQMN